MRRWALRVGLSVAAFSCSVLVCELILAVAMPQLGWRPLEHRVLGWATSEYRRLAAVPEEAESTGHRVLFVGDSYLAGAGVEGLDQRFPIVMARRHRPDLRVRVLATGGWGTDQEYLAFVQKGVGWRPDTVVLAFCANNDISNNLSNRHFARQHKPYFVLHDEGGLSLHTSDGAPLDDWQDRVGGGPGFDLRTWALLRYALRGAAPRTARADPCGRVDPRYLRLDFECPMGEIRRLEPQLSWSPQDGVHCASAYIHEDFPTNRYQWALFAAILGRLHRDVTSIGARLVVMLLPVSLAPRDARFIVGGSMVHRFRTPTGCFTFRADEPQTRLRAICDELGVDLFDPTAEFIATLRARKLVTAAWPTLRDRHFGPVAHAVLAGQVARYLPE